MVGEDPESREHEPALQRTHSERGARPALLQQLFEPLALAFVVAEDEGRRLDRGQGSQPAKVAVHPFGRQPSQLYVRMLIVQHQSREAVQQLSPALRFLEHIGASRDLGAGATRHLEVMLGLVPGAPGFLDQRTGRLLHHKSVGREQLKQGAAGFELLASSFELLASSFELRATGRYREGADMGHFGA